MRNLQIPVWLAAKVTKKSSNFFIKFKMHLSLQINFEFVVFFTLQANSPSCILEIQLQMLWDNPLHLVIGVVSKQNNTIFRKKLFRILKKSIQIAFWNSFVWLPNFWSHHRRFPMVHLFWILSDSDKFILFYILSSQKQIRSFSCLARLSSSSCRYARNGVLMERHRFQIVIPEKIYKFQKHLCVMLTGGSLF